MKECPQKSECRNTQGSYACDCHIGYDGEECKNIDECSNENPCRPHSECKDTDGSFECPCKTGFYENGDWCTNINECEKPETNTCPNNSNCKDTTGSYYCECHPGFSGESCMNINECEENTHYCRHD